MFVFLASYIQACLLDPLLNDGITFAQRLRALDQPVTIGLTVWYTTEMHSSHEGSHVTVDSIELYSYFSSVYSF